MFAQSKLDVHCASDTAHKTLLRHNSALLLQLNDKYTLRLFTRTETANAHYQPFFVKDQDQNTSPNGIDVGLDIRLIHNLLATRWMGHILIYCSEIASTQDVIQRAFGTLNPGCVAVSGYQTGGRGRRGTTWVSPAGALAVSMAVRLPAAQPERLTFVQYIAAMAAVDAIKMEKHWEKIPMRIKWPNDIYVNGSKLGGVLCEAVLRDGQFHIVVGFGLNVTNPLPTTCLRTLVNHCSESSDDTEDLHMRERFLAHYLTAFEALFDEFLRNGFEPKLKQKYLQSWLHTGQVVNLGSADGPKGIVRGLAPNGWVRVYREDLEAFQDLAPDVSSLDVREGVVREKLLGGSRCAQSSRVHE